jgi:hypothetical protein
MAAKFQSD